MDKVIKDNRFSHLASDPRFKRAPKYERKVKIDKRFQSMFTDDKFKVKYTVDKRGRPVTHSSNENLRKYYALSSEEEDDDSSGSTDSETKEKSLGGTTGSDTISNTAGGVNRLTDSEPLARENNRSSNRGKPKTQSTPGGFRVTDLSVPKSGGIVSKVKTEKIDDEVRKKLKNLDVDYARGESAILSDSSSDDESSDDSVAEFEERMAHEWGELDKDAGTIDQATCRLAVCNMDWDRIRAADLMVLFSSFTPVEGYIKSITIYPSEFGLQRMKEEDVKGPTELVSKSHESEDEEAEEGVSYHMEKLRKYQLNRLKYFYAVVECDSVATADKLYTECDGLEYESSAIRLDLRFIPDDMVFDQDPRESCDGIPDPSKYRPRHFITKALQQAKVECTWDETNPERLELAEKIMKANGEVNDEDIQAYLASSSDESEAEDAKVEDGDVEIDGNEEERISKYRALISDIQDKEKAKSTKDVEMEVTWGIGLKGETEKLVRQKLKDQEELTPFEKYLEKRKEKRKQKRKEKKQPGSKNHEEAFSDDDIPSDVDLDDSYFKEELEGSKKSGKAKKKGDELMKNKDSNEEVDRENYRAQLKLLLMDFSEKKNHFNMDEIMKQEKEKSKKKKRKGKKQEEEKQLKDDFQVDVKDPRFDALYNSHLFNIDPADPHYKKTKAMEALVAEKLNRRQEQNQNNLKTAVEPAKKHAAELSLLVKSVKRKAENMKVKKKQKTL
ncbi:ESF1 homolog [Hetaerina americana]|uniref:ESF1 homolog n=1 Tax=Hetaerina americana TaxID=62018 RepID=UPI003A7F3F84